MKYWDGTAVRSMVIGETPDQVGQRVTKSKTG